jgi:hypothetical protein
MKTKTFALVAALMLSPPIAHAQNAPDIIDATNATVSERGGSI